MSVERGRINAVEGISGNDITINQVYAPGRIGITPDILVKTGNANPFSPNWLIFVEESVAFFGRAAELAALEEFLFDPRPFAWWTVVGPGGTGKSRMALEAFKRLPQGWTGGFIAKRDVSADRIAVSPPLANTLWVLDYAGSHEGEKLREIISIFFQLAHLAEHKVRLLLLERGYSEESGWWAEVTRRIGRERGAVSASLYREPMRLTSLASGARPFLEKIVDSLPEQEGEFLAQSLHTISDEWLMDHSDHGNPLILEMLASELVRSAGQIAISRSPGAQGILESYFAREIDFLRDRATKAGLNFSLALDLLFVTTSVFPLHYLRKFDRLIIVASDDDHRVLLTKNESGQFEIPTVEQSVKLGLDAAEKENRNTLANLSKVTGIDAVESYLSLLDETGYSSDRHWAVQPDLLGQTLIQFVTSSSFISLWLRQKRPEFDRQRVAKLIEGVVALSPKRAWENWAKLDEQTLLVLTRLLQTQGKSIRMALVVIRMLNALRNSKLPFDPKVFFGENGRGADVGAYFDEVQSYISKPWVGDKELDRLARSEHAWILPYVESLLDLDPPKKLAIGSLICHVNSESVLERLTNVANFSRVLLNYAQDISFREDGIRSHSDLPLGRFVDESIVFLCDRCFRALVASRDRGLEEPYRNIEVALQSCSFAILNGLLNRQETPQTRSRAKEALRVARAVLEIAPNAEHLAKLERTSAALELMDSTNERHAEDAYFAALDRMSQYSGSAEYTGTLIDLLGFCVKGAAFDTLNKAFDHIASCPASLIVPNDIASASVKITKSILSSDGVSNDKIRLLIKICGTLQKILSSADDQAANDFQFVLSSAILIATGSPSLQEEILGLLPLARAAIDEDRCGTPLALAILNAATFCGLWDNHTSTTHFDIQTASPSAEELIQAHAGVTQEDYERAIHKIIKVELRYRTPTGQAWRIVRFLVVGNRIDDPDSSSILNRIHSNLNPYHNSFD